MNYSQTNFGFDDFFSNLKPEDIEGYTSSTSDTKTEAAICYSSTDQSFSSININLSSNDYLSETIADSENKTEESRQIDSKSQSVDGNEAQKKIPSSTNDNIETIQLPVKRINEDELHLLKKNARIAHTPTYDISKVNQKPVNPKNKDFRQTIYERYSKVYSKISNNNTDNMITSGSNLHPINTDSSSFKVEDYSSMINKTEFDIGSDSNLSIKNMDEKKSFKLIRNDKEGQMKNLGETCSEYDLMPISIQSNKISFKTRFSSLRKIYDELLSSKNSSEDSSQKALEIEKEICIRSKNLPSVYMSLLTSKICSLRNPDEPSITNIKQFKIDRCLTNNYSILKRPKLTYKDISEYQLVTLLEKLMIPRDILFSYGFPFRDLTNGLAFFSEDLSRKEDLIKYNHSILLTCDRCLKNYRNPQKPESGKCIYHPGHVYEFRSLGRVYSCCKNDSESIGCNSSEFHVTKGYQFIETRMGFVDTIPSNNTPKVYALDCEMCFTEAALELCRVTILDFEGNIVYDTLVKPVWKITDYNTMYSGLKESDFVDVNTTIEDVQAEILKLISAESFIIGHGLDSDFKVLKLFHKRVIDTTHTYPHKRGLPYKRALKNLAKEYLNKIIQDSVSGHDSIEDANAALELVKLKLQDEINKHISIG